MPAPADRRRHPDSRCRADAAGQGRTNSASDGVRLMLTSARTLAVTLDKLALAGASPWVRYRCRGPKASPTPTSRAGPTRRSSSRGRAAARAGCRSSSRPPNSPRSPARPGYLVQEYLPGEEYSVDVLADARGRVAASVPRLRARVDSGVSVAGRTVRDDELEKFGALVAEAVGLTFIGNVQCRRDRSGQLALLEVNPRAPGSMPLTIASGVDMPRLAMAALDGADLPGHVEFRETAMVRLFPCRCARLPRCVATALPDRRGNRTIARPASARKPGRTDGRDAGRWLPSPGSPPAPGPGNP